METWVGRVIFEKLMIWRIQKKQKNNNRRMVDAVEREEMISCCDAQQKLKKYPKKIKNIQQKGFAGRHRPNY